jgi:uncharacterized protein YjiS (DUF1127 family)
MSVCYENTPVIKPTFKQPVKRAGILHRMTNWFGRRYRVHRDKKKLHALPDSILKDIGIRRSDIDHAVEHRRP